MAQVAIIGAGPAGLSTALELKRHRISFYLFEKASLGGLLKNASLVENYPGFPKGILAKELLSRFQEHLTKWQITPRFEKVQLLDWNGEVFSLTTSCGQYTADIAVVASGTKPKKHPLEEQASSELRSYLGYEIKDLPTNFQGKVAIVGAGDAAFDYALQLAQRGCSVILLNRSQRIRALPVLRERVFTHPCITYQSQVEVKAIRKGGEHPLCLELSDKSQLETDWLLFAIGREPEKSFFSEKLCTEEASLLSQKKLFLIGDVRQGRLRQTAISVGQGIQCAMEIASLLYKEEKQ